MTKLKIFSEKYPTLRLVWDATTLEALMRDPLSYYWKYVRGYRSKEPSVDLLWGTAWDKALSFYHAEREHYDRPTALQTTITWAIEHAKKVELDQVAAESGNKARKKNLATLIRSIVWYDAEHGDYDLYEPVFTNPTTVTIPLDWPPKKPSSSGKRKEFFTPDGEQYYIVGNYDQIVRDKETGKLFVVERKTTATTISPHYWLSYDPSVQLNTYDWLACAGQHHRLHKRSGVFIEACQTAVGFTRFATHEVLRTPQQRAHWERVMQFWIKVAEHVAVQDNWGNAMNLATQQWESTTRNIERRSPAVWEGMLQTEMVRREPWNPLEID